MESNTTPVAKATTEKITAQTVLDMQELNERFTQFNNRQLAKFLDEMEVCDSLTIASMYKQCGTLNKFTAEDKTNLANAMQVSVEDLDAMTVQDFSKKALALMPDGMVDASMEVTLVELVAVGSILAFYIAYITGAIILGKKVTKMEIPWLTREGKEIIREKGQKALTELGVNSWSAKQLMQSVAACKDVLKFVDQDMKKIFDPKFPVVAIEKEALKLWSAPQSTVVSVSGTAGRWKSGITGHDGWWDEWRDNFPKQEFKTLKEHGWTIQSLEKYCDDLVDLCKEVQTIGNAYGHIVNGKLEAKKNDPGFFGKIKRFFSESIEEREKRKQAELIINAKFLGLRNLLWGFDYTVRVMSNDFFSMCNKMEKYISANKGK